MKFTISIPKPAARETEDLEDGRRALSAAALSEQKPRPATHAILTVLRDKQCMVYKCIQERALVPKSVCQTLTIATLVYCSRFGFEK